MYEIDISTLMLISVDENTTKVITLDKEFVVKQNIQKLIDRSCKYFGSSLIERSNMTKRLINFAYKAPIVIEESRNIIFFPLKSSRSKNNIWISFNNLDKYIRNNQKTSLIFKNKKIITLDFSYYIIDNQVTRSLLLDFEIKNRRKSLEK